MNNLPNPATYAVIYRHGIAVGVYPKPENPNYDIRDYAYRAVLLHIDGVLVNLLEVSDIQKIDDNIDIEATSSSVGRIDNDLRFQAASMREAGYHKQSIRILKKAHNIMERYLTWWRISSFFELPRWLYEDDRDDEADEECRRIRKLVFLRKQLALEQSLNIQRKLFDECDTLQTDLVVMNYQHTCCGECAKYRSRIYSISGNDKRFPALPKDILRYGCIHDECNCLFYPTSSIMVDIGVENMRTITLYDEEAVAYSNRPFIDDRTPECIERYEKWSKRQEKARRDEMYIGFEDRVRKTGKIRRDFRLVKEHIPQRAPKTYESYRYMKSRQTANFMKIVELMAEKGISLNDV